MKGFCFLSGMLVGLCVFHSSARANLPPPQNYPIGKPTLACVADAARYHRVPLAVLLGVNSVEMGNTMQDVSNTNGTVDTGAFQINSIHFAEAATFGANHHDLAARGCYNAQYAAMLLSRAINHPKKQHKDFFTRAAGYHSWTPKHNSRYRKKLIKYTLKWQKWLAKRGIMDIPASNSSMGGMSPVGIQKTSLPRQPAPFNPWR